MLNVGLSSFQEIEKHDWIVDSGASCHMCNDQSAMYNLEDHKTQVLVGNGEEQEITKMGEVKGTLNGKPVSLKNVLYVPSLMCNLFSVTSCLSKGFEVQADSAGFKLKKNNMIFEF